MENTFKNEKFYNYIMHDESELTGKLMFLKKHNASNLDAAETQLINMKNTLKNIIVLKIIPLHFMFQKN